MKSKNMRECAVWTKNIRWTHKIHWILSEKWYRTNKDIIMLYGWVAKVNSWISTFKCNHVFRRSTQKMTFYAKIDCWLELTRTCNATPEYNILIVLFCKIHKHRQIENKFIDPNSAKVVFTYSVKERKEEAQFTNTLSV